MDAAHDPPALPWLSLTPRDAIWRAELLDGRRFFLGIGEGRIVARTHDLAITAATKAAIEQLEGAAQGSLGLVEIASPADLRLKVTRGLARPLYGQGVMFLCATPELHGAVLALFAPAMLLGGVTI